MEVFDQKFGLCEIVNLKKVKRQGYMVKTAWAIYKQK